MAVTDHDLHEHAAFVLTDNAFQREARLLQALWRESKGLAMGLHRGRPLGSQLAMPEAALELTNFLTENVRAVVRREVLDPQRARDKLFGRPRLFDNLLSSQPLCFNLFGEPSLDLALASRAFGLLTAGRVARVTRVELEHSPGRSDARFTGDRSAFDVFVEYVTARGERGFVGIEVKYHEDLDDRPAAHRTRYEEVAAAMGCFDASAVSTRLRQKPLQQIWRDHLLAGSLLEAGQYEQGLFAFVYPERNDRCADAVRAYEACLLDGRTFQPWTLEQVVAALREAGAGQWVRDLQRRYLDFDGIPGRLASPPARMTSYFPSFDVIASRVTDRVDVGGGEGFGVSSARFDGQPALVVDQSGLLDMVDEEDEDLPGRRIVVETFADDAQRAAHLTRLHLHRPLARVAARAVPPVLAGAAGNDSEVRRETDIAALRSTLLKATIGWAHAIRTTLRPLLAAHGERAHFRPTADGVTMVGLLHDRPQRGKGRIRDLARLLRSFDALFRDHCEVVSQGRGTAEKALQSALIREAQTNGGRLVSLNAAAALTDTPVDLTFVTDEIALWTDEHGERVCDILALRRDGGRSTPVLIELKSARSLTRLVDQVEAYAAGLDASADLFAELFTALLGEDIHFDGPAEKWILWPRAGDERDPREEQLAVRGIRVVGYDERAPGAYELRVGRGVAHVSAPGPLRAHRPLSAALLEAVTWCDAASSPTGRRVLDVRRAMQMLSASDEAEETPVVTAAGELQGLASGSPRERCVTPVDWALDDEEITRLRAGFTPCLREDMWWIVARDEGGRVLVYFRQRWNNQLELILEIANGCAVTLQHPASAFRPEATARALVDAYLLGRTCVVPAPRALGEDKSALVKHGFALVGCRCDFVEPEEPDDVRR